MGRVLQNRPLNISCTEEKNINFSVPSLFHSALSPSLDAHKNEMLMDVAKKKILLVFLIK